MNTPRSRQKSNCDEFKFDKKAFYFIRQLIIVFSLLIFQFRDLFFSLKLYFQIFSFIR